MNSVKKAVVLLSGGLDSSTALYWAKAKGYRCIALIGDYGQRHRCELRAALSVARAARCPVQRVRFNMPWGGSSLTDKRMPLPAALLPRSSTGGRSSRASRIPSTYVPARNTILLSFAFSCAEAVGARAAVIGANCLDYSGYPDCRPAYFSALARALRIGTRAGAVGKPIKILAPLLKMTKVRIIRLGIRLGVPYRLTWSCYEGGEKPCGRCDSCRLRAKGFAEAGLPDPAVGKSR